MSSVSSITNTILSTVENGLNIPEPEDLAKEEMLYGEKHSKKNLESEFFPICFSILQPTRSMLKSKNIHNPNNQSQNSPEKTSLLVSPNFLESATLLNSLRALVVVFSLPDWILSNFWARKLLTFYSNQIRG